MSLFNADFLEKLLKYYADRLCAARQKGFDDPRTQYHWLYRELAIRVESIEQTKLLLGLLPGYLYRSDTENAMAFVTQFVSVWYLEESVGRLPHDAEGRCCYFSEQDPYWEDVQAAGARVDGCGNEADALRCISEYVICCLRLYFYMREHQFKAIDGSKFARLMGLADSQPSAEG